MKLTTDFETALKVLLFISPSNVKDEKLNKFTNNIEVHFASRKKIQILAKARNMLLQSNFSISQDYITRISGLNEEEIVEDFSNHVVLLFSYEKCVVSEAATELMDLVHQTLKAVRNALVLYEAIVPVKLDTINQAAVLFHNDCLYLSQEILGLAFEINRDAEEEQMRAFSEFVVSNERTLWGWSLFWIIVVFWFLVRCYIYSVGYILIL